MQNKMGELERRYLHSLGLSIGYSVLAKNMFKMKPADLGRYIEDVVKVIVVITAGIASKDFLVTQGINPENINT